jgi:hypothetical protein
MALARLNAANVVFLGESIMSPVCEFALIVDSDGNGITIHKRKVARGLRSAGYFSHLITPVAGRSV